MKTIQDKGTEVTDRLRVEKAVEQREEEVKRGLTADGMMTGVGRQEPILGREKGENNKMKRLFLFLLVILIGVGAVSVVDRVADVRRPKIGDDQVLEEVVESRIPQVVDLALPSVVTVGVKANGEEGSQGIFGPFFGERGEEVNIGSGFIVSADGLIITNRHVVSQPEATYKVILNDGREFEVQRIYRDPLNDLAILDIEAVGLDPLELGSSGDLNLGETVVAIGTPLGEFTNSVTSGIISGLGRGIEAGNPFQGSLEELDDVIQTDAAINPGNSGGPLINIQGEVIGVNTAIAAGGQNLGFAIPIDTVQGLLDNFIASGVDFSRPYIGVRYQMVSETAARANDIPQGAYLNEVVEGTPAAEAGLQVGDIITRFDGQDLELGDGEGLRVMIAEVGIGERVGLVVWRGGEVIELELVIGETSV